MAVGVDPLPGAGLKWIVSECVKAVIQTVKDIVSMVRSFLYPADILFCDKTFCPKG